ncbi:MAG: DNA-protecting protein DprA [Candidatus Thioglobus sp.]|nr:DNA-protecting protein DprA [Candidatus Thioglobus sp.]
MDLIYWLLLLKAPKLGMRTFYKTLQVFETPEQVFSASKSARKECGLFKSETLEFLAKCDKTTVRPDLDWAKSEDCNILTLADEDYPEQLKTTSEPPPLLYVRGDVKCLSKPQLAIVGSRNPSASGEKHAYEFAQDLAKIGLLITSGMASGIDAKAHLGALEAGQATIAVCGTGLDRVYPARHKSLAHQISTQGALVSEFAIGTAPLANNFPRRNRVISGLSLGTLVVEASVKSGTMITAKLAAEQGREVFAIPSSIHNPLAAGCHQLIKDGAKLVENIDDITNELAFEFQAAAGKNIDTKDTKDTKELDKNHLILLKCLGYEPLSIDGLVEKSGLSPQIVMQKLLELELENQVAKDGSGYLLTK